MPVTRVAAGIGAFACYHDTITYSRAYERETGASMIVGRSKWAIEQRVEQNRVPLWSIERSDQKMFDMFFSHAPSIAHIDEETIFGACDSEVFALREDGAFHTFEYNYIGDNLTQVQAVYGENVVTVSSANHWSLFKGSLATGEMRMATYQDWTFPGTMCTSTSLGVSNHCLAAAIHDGSTRVNLYDVRANDMETECKTRDFRTPIRCLRWAENGGIEYLLLGDDNGNIYTYDVRQMGKWQRMCGLTNKSNGRRLPGIRSFDIVQTPNDIRVCAMYYDYTVRVFPSAQGSGCEIVYENPNVGKDVAPSALNEFACVEWRAPDKLLLHSRDFSLFQIEL